MKIKAALSSGADAPFEIAEVELDEPRADEVLVKLSAVGVCHTDLTMKAVWPAGRCRRSCSGTRAPASSRPSGPDVTGSGRATAS